MVHAHNPAAAAASPFDCQAVRRAVFTWWRGLDHNRGARAWLRRAKSPAVLLRDPRRPGEIAARRSIVALRDKVDKILCDESKGKIHLTEESLAAIAGLLAHVRSDVSNAKSFACLFVKSDDGGPTLSERRFERLLCHGSIGMFYNDLRRVLRQLDHRAPVVALARDVYAWSDGSDHDMVRHKWARIYYEKAIKEPDWTPPETSEQRDKLAAATYAWWESLNDHAGERSRLRRCGSIGDVHLTRGYHRLRKYMRLAGISNPIPKRLAAVAGILVHVREHYQHEADEQWEWAAFAELAASSEERLRMLKDGKKLPKKLQQTSAPLREDRFHRLLQAESHTDLYRPLIRAIHLLGGRADAACLATDIYCWNEKTRRRWADRYYCIAEPE